MDDVTYEALQQKIGELTVQNKQLARTNARLRRNNKKLKNIITKKNKEIKQLRPEKQHYRNGWKRSKYGRY